VLVNWVLVEPETLKREQRERLAGGLRVDWIGFALIAVTFGSLEFVLDRGQEDDWFSSPLILSLAIVSAVALVTLAVRECLVEEPIVDLRLLSDRTFAVSSLLMFMLGFVLLGSTFLVPAFVQELLGYTATDAGLVITPGALSLVLLMPIIGRLVGRVDPRWLIAFGLAVCGGALLRMAGFDLTTPYRDVMLARLIQSVGLSCLFIPINTEVFSNVPPGKTNNASALINVWRNLGGSVGISVGSTLLLRRSQFHQSVLVAAASPGHGPYVSLLQGLTARLSATFGADAPSRAIAVIGQMIERQARLLSYLDAFAFFGMTFIAMLPIVLLMKKGAAHGGSPAAH
ncbi:MAG: DHA2 family efflux MFS transporter permease subunit, partial [Gammaproteobacteria bacterium]|nr:DHA2 family efflux MFS transporter permease subunit [Gammaproteobacteria bacterium]